MKFKRNKVRQGPATSTAPPGIREAPTVCKLIDTSTCIGCKACEVACLEWNGYPFRETAFDNTYQTMPETRWNFWNLIKFNEHPNGDGTIQWLMRKDQCMHCADPGCLRACPADGAIVQYANGIVDFQQENCIGCEACFPVCPVEVKSGFHLGMGNHKAIFTLFPATESSRSCFSVIPCRPRKTA